MLGLVPILLKKVVNCIRKRKTKKVNDASVAENEGGDNKALKKEDIVIERCLLQNAANNNNIAAADTSLGEDENALLIIKKKKGSFEREFCYIPTSKKEEEVASKPTASNS
mmetsp:Transcript_100226/g.139296  ORF Transcript_100226/g.139296 Transcript_100226/m.139296 type:complete len:111 (-) Transcript_100226:243-575(-)